MNYTWSKSLGIRGDYLSGSGGDPVHLRNNYGILGIDRTHVFNVHYSYEEGRLFKGSPIVGLLLNNWMISGITSLQSGADLQFINGNSGNTDFNLGTGNYTLPVDAVPGGAGQAIGFDHLPTTRTTVSVGSADSLGSPEINLMPTLLCDPSKKTASKQFLNPACFALPQVGANGNFNMPYIHAPAYFNSDLSVYKNIKINERQRLQLQLSGFNFLNHPLTSFNSSNTTNISMILGSTDYNTNPNTYSLANYLTNQPSTLNANTFGYITTKVGRRLVEMGVKYTF